MTALIHFFSDRSVSFSFLKFSMYLSLDSVSNKNSIYHRLFKQPDEYPFIDGSEKKERVQIVVLGIERKTVTVN